MINSKKQAKIDSGYDGHIMNKAEAKALRQIQAETKMTEKEIRSVKKYRKMLSDARNKSENLKSFRRYFDRFVPATEYNKIKKKAFKKTGLVLHHPNTIAEIKEEIDKRSSTGWNRNRVTKDKLLSLWRNDEKILKNNLSK